MLFLGNCDRKASVGIAGIQKTPVTGLVEPN